MEVAVAQEVDERGSTGRLSGAETRRGRCARRRRAGDPQQDRAGETLGHALLAGPTPLKLTLTPSVVTDGLE